MSHTASGSELFLGNQELSSRINSKQTFALGRLGSVEAQIVEIVETKSKATLRDRKLAWINAGISYPTGSQLLEFFNEYTKSLCQMDVMACWPETNIPNQSFLIKKYGLAGSGVIPLRILDPIQSVLSGINSADIWTHSLKDKNVLVISTFAETINGQYGKRSELHQVHILPSFSLKTIVPPVTNGATFWKGGYTRNLRNFRKQLENMKELDNIDIALVSAGAYGLPVMATLKKLGISSIYMGGSLQLLFGIMGNRWREIESISSIATPNWLIEAKENKPFGYRLVENGSYW